MKYKLNRTVYIEEDDNSVSDIYWVGESKLHAKKGRLYNRIEVTEDNFEKLEEDYWIERGCKYIYESINGKWNHIYIYDENNDWFDEVKEK